MATEILNIHYQTPEVRKINHVADTIKKGGVILVPTDTGFTLACELSNKNAITKIRRLRDLPESKAMTFLCDSLSNVAEFAKVNDNAYKTIKRLIPGPYTFILPASKLVPKFAQDPKRKTSGLRVPADDLSQLLLKSVGMPIISISAKIDGENLLNDPEEVIDFYSSRVDIAITCDKYSFRGESTILDMTGEEFSILREGAGMKLLREMMD